MWEDNRRKTITVNIILVILSIGLLAALACAVIYVRRVTEEHDAQLSDIQIQQQQEQTEQQRKNRFFLHALPPVRSLGSMRMQSTSVTMIATTIMAVVTKRMPCISG